MLYFAYGSNLNHFQMKRRCKDSVFLKKYNLKGYRLNFRSKYRAADIEKKRNSIVQGALFEISKSDEKKLDVYENYPVTYIKKYFTLKGTKVMYYYMPKKTKHFPPSKRYLNIIIQGYKDCGYRDNYIVVSKNKKIKVR